MEAAAVLGQMRVAEATPALIENLERDPEGAVRSEAAKALGRIGSSAAVEPLIRCFKAQGYPELDHFAGNIGYGPWWEVQSQALAALGELGDERATQPVIEALADEDAEDLQESAFRVLARLNSAQAKVLIIGQLKAGGHLARRRAAKALAALAELRGTGAGFPPEFVSPLLDALLDPDAAVRIEAARALAGSGEPVALVPLTLLLGDPQPEVRTEIVSLLAAMGGERVLERLHSLLAEPNPALQRSVARALGEIGDARSALPLSALLETGDADLLYEAVHALGRIARAGAEGKLAAILHDGRAHHTVRVQAARALGRIGAKGGATEPQALTDLLTRCVFDADERVAQAALCALAEIDPAGAPARLVDLLEARAPTQGSREESVRPHAAVPPELEDMVAGQTARTSTLAAILFARGEGAAQAGDALPESRPALANGVRVLAVRLLGDCANPGVRAIEALVKACASSDSALRREALLALGRIGDRQGLAALLAGLEDEAGDVRLAALEALCGMRDVPEVAGRLAALCDDPDANVRARAVQALAAAKGQEAAGRLCRALGDENTNVCRAALRALSPATYTTEHRQRVVELVFRFSGELRAEAAAALRRLEDFDAASPLLAALEAGASEEREWMAIDALGELYAEEEAPQ
jgi:HEAT repeat protein